MSETSVWTVWGKNVSRNGKPTLADIAARTGYGTNTVSLALRGSTRISQVARDAIRAAAEAMDYVPNNYAKSLVLKRSHTVGMLLEDLTNPQPTAVATALQRELSKLGYGVLFATNNTADQEAEAIEMVRSRMVDGLLIYPVDHTKLDHLRRLRARNFPVVLLVGACDTGLDAVGVDEFQAAFDATTHLIALGHTKIGAIGSLHVKPLKLEGFRHAHAVHGLALNESQIIDPAEHSTMAGFCSMQQLHERNLGLTAVFAASDIFGLGVLRWARVNGVSVPEELSVVGYDNIEIAEFAFTSLTTVRNDASTLARAAVARLMTLINTEGPLPPPELTLLHGELEIRESSSRRGQRAWIETGPHVVHGL